MAAIVLMKSPNVSIALLLRVQAGQLECATAEFFGKAGELPLPHVGHAAAVISLEAVFLGNPIPLALE